MSEQAAAIAEQAISASRRKAGQVESVPYVDGLYRELRSRSATVAQGEDPDVVQFAGRDWIVEVRKAS